MLLATPKSRLGALKALLWLLLGLLFIIVIDRPTPVLAQGPWGHSAKHGYTGYDVVRHLGGSTIYQRASDGSLMAVSSYSPNGGPGTVSFHTSTGAVRTAFGSSSPRRFTNYVSGQVDNGYVQSSVPGALVAVRVAAGVCAVWVAGACTDVYMSTTGWTSHGLTPSGAIRNIRQSTVN